MWPFSRKRKAPMEAISYSQVDITVAFGDNERLGPDDWITTVPLNATTKIPSRWGCPGRSRARTRSTASRPSCPASASRSRSQATAYTVRCATSLLLASTDCGRLAPNAVGGC